LKPLGEMRFYSACRRWQTSWLTILGRRRTIGTDLARTRATSRKEAS